MSRLGKMPIPLPKGVEVKVTKEGTAHFKGPKGTLELKMPPGLSLRLEGQVALVERDEKIVEDKALHGLYRSLVKNSLIGVSEGFEVRLSMVGVGYRAAVQGNRLELQIGLSHPAYIEIPKSIQVVVDKGTAIAIKGIDKQQVGQLAADIRACKPPEPYKQKGIRYEGEQVRKKEGKAAKGKA